MTAVQTFLFLCITNLTLIKSFKAITANRRFLTHSVYNISLKRLLHGEICNKQKLIRTFRIRNDIS